MNCYRGKIRISPTASFLLWFLILFFTACFRPAPPLEEGDEPTAKVSARTETNGSITVEGHPIAKKRVAPRWSKPTPSTTVANHSPPQTTTGGGAPASGSGGTPVIEPGGSSNPTPTAKLFDPDVRVIATSQESVSFALGANLGSTSQIKVALAAYGKQIPREFCTGANSTLLPPGTMTYTYSGLSAGSKYGFRFCSWDGNTASPGATVSAETEAQNFENGTDNWTLIDDQNPTANRNQVYTSTPSNKMYGPFQMGESIAKQFQLNGERVKISFDFLRLNSWDGEDFRVFISENSELENLLFSESFHHGTFDYNYFGSPSGYQWRISSPQQNGFCFPNCNSFTSARHRVTIDTPASITSLTLRFTTTLNQKIEDESWGIDNFRLSP